MQDAPLTIDPEFRDLLPPLGHHERLLLAKSIRDHGGCYDPLKVWIDPTGKPIVVDGMNRLEIVEEEFHDDDEPRYSVEYLEFPDREAVKDWIDRHQASRRNLPETQLALIRGRIYNREKLRHGGARNSSRHSDDLIGDQAEPERTSEKLAEEFGVSPRTIERNGQLAEAVEKVAPVVPDVAAKVATGEVSQKQVIEAARETTPTGIKERIEGREATVKAPIAEPAEWSVDDDIDYMARVLGRLDKERHRMEGNWQTEKDQRKVREFFNAWAKTFERWAKEV